MNKTIITGLVLCLSATMSSSQIYTWTDSNGSIHFSDTPRKGAKKITLPPMQTFTPKPNTNAIDSAIDTQEEKKTLYKSVTIVEPSNQTTSRDNQGRIPILVETIPALKPGDKVQILLDGQPIGSPQKSTSFLLSNVLRGEHTLSAAIVNASGDSLLESQAPIIIYMHRPRTGMTSNTPAPRGAGRKGS